MIAYFVFFGTLAYIGGMSLTGWLLGRTDTSCLIRESPEGFMWTCFIWPISLPFILAILAYEIGAKQKAAAEATR